MYNEKMEGTLLEIKGNSFDDCRAKLYNEYGTDYSIISHDRSFVGGFLGFGQKEVVTVKYMVTPHSAAKSMHSPEDDKDSFRRNRDDLLKKADPSVTNNLQMAQIAKK